MKKIVFIESASEMGGVEFSTLYLAAHLDRSKWQPLVICPQEGKLSVACQDANIRVQILTTPNLIPTSFRLGSADTRFPNPLAWLWNPVPLAVAAWSLKKILQREKPDLVITKGLQAHFFGGIAARVTRRRCIWHVQDFISERFFGVYRVFFGWAASLLPDEIIVDGGAIAAQLPHAVQKRVFVVLNGVDTNIFAPDLQARENTRTALGLREEHLVIGHAARITPWKGQHHLLEAFSKIARRHPHARLVLVGAAIFDNADYEKKIKMRTIELGLQDKVIFTGFRSDLPEVLNAIDIFAYPSVEKDTSPLALLSALACGLPIVAFDIPGIQEVLQGDGIIVPVKDEQALSAALEKIIADPAMRNHMQSQSRSRALEHFSLEKYVECMERVFLCEG